MEEFVKTSDKDILISWVSSLWGKQLLVYSERPTDLLNPQKHRELHQIATALGASNARIHYPDER